MGMLNKNNNIMTDEIKDKIAKVYELVKRGEQGEQKAAEKALERLLKKYNLSAEEIAKIYLKEYKFKYATELDKMLFLRLCNYFFKDKYTKIYLETWRVKELCMEMEYLDWVQMECAYEYFRKHMNKEWKKHALPLVKRCRTNKTTNKRRAELQEAFFYKYVFASKIYREEELTTRGSKVSDKEFRDYMAMSGVQGGKFNNQVTTGLYLE